MSTRLFIGGIRGSRPATGDGFAEFGAETTALLILGPAGERLVIDAGSGLRAVARELAKGPPGEVTVLFTHFHLDHLLGLVLCPLFYQRGWRFRFLAPALPPATLRETLARFASPPYWPVPFLEMGAPFEFAEFAPTGLRLGGLHVTGCPVPHPNGCWAYRIADAATGHALVFATDLEWAARSPAEEQAFLTLCQTPAPAQCLLMDAQFTPDNAAAHRGWGHSAWNDALEVARRTGIRRLLLGHHAPEADDATLRQRETQLRKLAPGVAFARANQWLDLA